MNRILAIVGLVGVVAVAIGVMVSGKPNETPRQHPETTPPSQRAQEVDPKSVGGTALPKPQ
jgi:hypothetical protein